MRLGFAVVAALTVLVLEVWPAIAADQPPGLQPVSVGFVSHAFGTWTAKIADGGFETGTGRSLRWQPFDTDSGVVAALASGRLDVGLIGTGVAAAAVARGLDLKVFFVLGNAADSETLMLKSELTFRPGDAKALQQMVIAVPFGSTPHFRLLQSLRRWGASPGNLRLVNLQVPQIASAWGRKEIDTAVVSEPQLPRFGMNGRSVPLPAAGGQEGRLVFAGGADFVATHMVFLSRFVDVITRADVAFAHMDGPLDANRREVKAISFLTGHAPEAVIASIARFRPPRLEDQVSSKWLGGGAASGIAAELKANAEVWRWAGRLDGTERDFAAAVTPVPVELALKYQQ